jgi:hypothetical protein
MMPDPALLDMVEYLLICVVVKTQDKLDVSTVQRINDIAIPARRRSLHPAH